MITIAFTNSIASTGKKWTFTDTTDYSAVVLTSITLRIWDPTQDPSVDTPVIENANPIGSPNTAIEFLPTDFGLVNDTTTLTDGIYTIDLVVVSDDADSPQTQRGYYLNVHNLKQCISEKTEAAIGKTCDCREEDFEYINKMNTILNGMCFNFQKQNFSNVSSMLSTLQNMCDDEAPCGC